ncbi:Short chain dehydrogenase virK [Paramyrothecium foliicola]|nr:Short chain dehydrogenase virK [Paramyrothecium foliicola]
MSYNIMPSWAITGASRGIGSDDSTNDVFALIRGEPTGDLAELVSSRENVHYVKADVADPESIAQAANEVSKITGGKLDVLISNACHPGLDLRFYPTTAFLGKEKELKNEIDACMSVNLLGAIYSINNFLPLIRKGEQKKIIYITSPSGDATFTRQVGVTVTVGYSITKAGMNLVMSKYAAELGHEGIKTLSLSPGWVDTDGTRDMAPTQEVLDMALKVFQKVNPNLTGLLTTEESVQKQLAVINGLTAEQSGLSLSHHGDNNWL